MSSQMSIEHFIERVLQTICLNPNEIVLKLLIKSKSISVHSQLREREGAMNPDSESLSQNRNRDDDDDVLKNLWWSFIIPTI